METFYFQILTHFIFLYYCSALIHKPMNRLKLLPVLFFCIISSIAIAQEKKYFISAPTDLKEVGWNKVLCMKNGNTMLFHFEPDKRIVVNVYDSLHKQIAHQEHLCRIVDIYIIKDALFKGLYDINGEAVLFLEQEHLSKNRLIRLRFNSADGSLLEEKLVGESQSISKRTYFSIMKNKDDDNYAILFSTDVPQFLECKVHVACYDKNHEIVKDIPLDVDRKNYDYMKVVGAETQPNGICITLALAKLELNGTVHNSLVTPGEESVYGHNLAVFYIPKDSTRPSLKMIDVTQDIFPYYSNYTYNPFSKSLNLLLLSYKSIAYRNGLEWIPGALTANLFFKLDENNLDIAHNWISNKIANAYLKQKTDTTRNFQGLPVKMFTNENGLSTLVSESYNRYGIPSFARPDYNSYIGNICITQFDDDGNEIWGTILPNSQCYTSHTHYCNPYQLSKRWQVQQIFGDWPPQVYERQFVSINTYSNGNNSYIVYNDYNKNFNNSIEHPGDTVYNFNITNACYYKMNRKKEITKNYLFGEPAANEYKTSFIEGADFDEQRGVYATLVQYKKNDNVTLCMAWSRLD